MAKMSTCCLREFPELEKRLVLRYRETTLKLTLKMLARWGATMSRDEAQSAADMALVRAAKGFRPAKGAHFPTYLFYFVKDELVKAIRFERKGRNCEELTEAHYAGSHVSMPEHELALVSAINSLSETEQKVITAVFVHDNNTTEAARELKLCRTYASEVKVTALKKLKHALNADDGLDALAA